MATPKRWWQIGLRETMLLFAIVGLLVLWLMQYQQNRQLKTEARSKDETIEQYRAYVWWSSPYLPASMDAPIPEDYLANKPTGLPAPDNVLDASESEPADPFAPASNK